MRRSLALAPLILALLFGCGASTSKPADAPQGEPTENAAPAQDHADKPAAADEPTAPTAPTTGGVKRSGNATDVPDDYSLTENDCQALGRGYGDAARADQRAALNPKLTAKQVEQANASIDAAVSKVESTWTETCLKSLAGKVVDHKNITCALAAKTVKAFDVCLNGEKK